MRQDNLAIALALAALPEKTFKYLERNAANTSWTRIVSEACKIRDNLLNSHSQVLPGIIVSVDVYFAENSSTTVTSTVLVGDNMSDVLERIRLQAEEAGRQVTMICDAGRDAVLWRAGL